MSNVGTLLQSLKLKVELGSRQVAEIHTGYMHLKSQ